MLDPTHPLSTVAAQFADRWWLGPGILIDHPAVDPQARATLADQLTHAFREQVAHLALRTVITDFHAFRESLGLPPDPQSQRAVQAYRTHLADPHHRTTAPERHPVLDQQVARIASQQAALVGEILQAFDDDADRLCGIGLLRNKERVTGLELAVGDTQQSGRAGTVVHTNSGRHLVYKPHSLALDSAMGRLWTVLNPGLRHSIAGCVPLSVDRGEYGWQAFIAHERAMSSDACSRYFYRFGALIAVAAVRGATDLTESVVTHGEHPVVIDLEKMRQPETSMLRFRDGGSVMDLLLAELGKSLLRMSDRRRLQVADADSDAMAVRRQPWSVTQDSNLPLVDGQPQTPLAWYADVRSGLRDALVAIRQHRTELEEGLNALPEQAKIRLGFSTTDVYRRYLDAVTDPALPISDPSADDEVLDLLSTPASAAGGG